MIKHPTLTPDQYRTAMQDHLDEVIFVLVMANATAQRVVELIELRERIERMLDDAIYGERR